MSLSEMLVPEFDQEMQNTRKFLESLPEDRFDFRPHEKSLSLQDLASHIINVPTWIGLTVNADSFDVAPEGGERFHVDPIESVSDALALFDRNVSEALDVLTGATDEQLSGPWTLLSGGNEMFTMPKMAVYRSMIMNHFIHHRAQLGVYLRMNDVPVPAVYGPTADSAEFEFKQ